MVQNPLRFGTDATVVSVTPHGVHLGAAWQTDTVLRVDSLTYPELYVEIDTSALRDDADVVVPGRFSDELFHHGSVARPRCRWTVHGRELEISSEHRDFVAVLAL